eukprot:scaffold88344_cov51-Phaeocystis_antarctica.AAC.2
MNSSLLFRVVLSRHQRRAGPGDAASGALPWAKSRLSGGSSAPELQHSRLYSPGRSAVQGSGSACGRGSAALARKRGQS